MKKYLFQLGHQPHISTAEIQAVFSKQKINFKILSNKDNFLVIETKKDLNINELIHILGGTIKIGEHALNTPHLEEFAEYIEQIQSTGKINFSISGKNAKKKALQIKKLLKSLDRSVRYIEPKNTATILHNKLVEKHGDFTVINNDFFITKAIQPFEDFGERDYNRPGFDNKSGMLPPKLARIMINLSQKDSQNILLDPFCGSGTVLTEAITLGFTKMIGSDISTQAIDDTKRNIEWVLNQYHIPPIDYKIIKNDVQNIGENIEKKVDVIISEPYMGKPLRGKETAKELNDQIKELRRLYVNAFKVFYKILKQNGSIIFIIPKFRHENKWLDIKCLNEIKKLGFKIEPLSEKSKSLLYWREKQYVGREIWKFVK
jgi:tRNA G10  N-methylase Trm11